jgi:hypothetical protein
LCAVGLLSCPTCRATTPFESLASLKVNFALVDFLTLVGRTQPRGAALCKECEDNKATVSCTTCNDVLCSDCFDETHKSKVMSKHVKAAVGQAAATAEAVCGEHKQPALLYCIDCKVPLLLPLGLFSFASDRGAR